MDTFTAPWMAELVLLSWRSVVKNSRPPLPSELLATFVVFGTFSLVSTRQPRVGAALGWGMVVATFLNLFGTENRLVDPFAKTSGKVDNSTVMGPVANRTGGK